MKRSVYRNSVPLFLTGALIRKATRMGPGHPHGGPQTPLWHGIGLSNRKAITESTKPHTPPR
jgi:hypothetical protein